MDQRWRAELMLIEHRHSDGSWGSLEPERSHHDVADHDPERDWAEGQVFRCKDCDEQFRVRLPDGTTAERE
jgi:hypothetical protein